MLNLFRKNRIKKETEFIETIKKHRYIKTTKIVRNEERLIGYDTAKYFIDYSHKTKILTLKSKNTGKVITIHRKDLK